MTNPTDDQQEVPSQQSAVGQNEDEKIDQYAGRGYPNWVPVIGFISFLLVLAYGVAVLQGWIPKVGQDKLGQLGDFVGGITNPLLAFLTFTALLYTINLQRVQIKFMSKELALSRRQAEQSTKALEESSLHLDRSASTQEKVLEAQIKLADAQQETVDLMKKAAAADSYLAKRERLQSDLGTVKEELGMLRIATGGIGFNPSFHRIKELEKAERLIQAALDTPPRM